MRVRVVVAALGLVVCLLPAALAAQEDRTLADIRQDLTVLNVEMQKLKRELSTTGGPQVATGGSSLPDRVQAIEAELQRLTALTERLQFRIDSIVEDGTRRIGDLEFRLVELEGGDVSQLGETSTLGGVPPEEEAPAPVAEQTPEQAPATELAVGERADFEAAEAAFEAGNHAEAAAQFRAFNETYPGSPLAARADLMRGRALSGQGDTREAARAFLAAFQAAPQGEHAADALYELGAALGRLGQVDQACITLGEVGVRFAGSEAVAQADREMAALGCQ
ncbi:MAG TPA: tol-pal system protein YbgF [Rhodobacteraceae bacterium]|nr:tol-pal system protein YbgF [Paracoccaceae bacterium]